MSNKKLRYEPEKSSKGKVEKILLIICADSSYKNIIVSQFVQAASLVAFFMRNFPQKNEVAMTVPLTPSRPLFNPKSSALAGMSREQLQQHLTELQNAYLALQSGQQVASVSYTQGDGSRSVSYRAADAGQLLQTIRLVQAQLGMPGTRRSALRPVF